MTIKEKIYEIITESKTVSAKIFDLILILFILFSILSVMLDSVASIHNKYFEIFDVIEWTFTFFFSLEYLLRLYSSKKTKEYMFSFFGMIDFFSTIPSYVSFFLPGTQYFMILRILRVLRIFRILKLVKYIHEGKVLLDSLIASQRKIIVFLFSVLSLVVLLGSIMYVIESKEAGFTSIPKSIYWAIVTLTTVGYGDISPQTPFGQFIASFIMIIGYVIIAVPTGIVTSNLIDKNNKTEEIQRKYCIDCDLDLHQKDALFCRRCAGKLEIL